MKLADLPKLMKTYWKKCCSENICILAEEQRNSDISVYI